MKQGRASVDVSADQKREPIAHAVSEKAVAQIGTAQAHIRATETLYKGRGFEAPLAGSDSHPSGSQGKHR